MSLVMTVSSLWCVVVVVVPARTGPALRFCVTYMGLALVFIDECMQSLQDIQDGVKFI